MAKPKKWQVPFAGNRPCFWAGSLTQPHEYEGEMRCLIPGEKFEVREKVTWRDNFEFQATMTLTGMESGNWSAKHCIVQDEKGMQYIMFLVDLVAALRVFPCTPSPNGGQLAGFFTFSKRGRHYGVKMVSPPPQPPPEPDWMSVPSTEWGDLLAAAFQLATECGWDVESAVRVTLAKIERRKDQYSTLKRKVKVAICGTAADPVTLGHCPEIPLYVLNTIPDEVDEVWLMPCGNHHKFGKELQPANHRLKMLQLAARNDPRIKVFDYEIRNDLSGSTYETMKRLMDDPLYKDQYNFSLIIGMSNANEAHQWENWELLERLVRFIVVPRKGYRMDPKIDWYLKPPHIFIGYSDQEIREVSSSAVRAEIEKIKDLPLWERQIAGTPLAQMIDPVVFFYISEHNLYGFGGKNE